MRGRRYAKTRAPSVDGTRKGPQTKLTSAPLSVNSMSKARTVPSFIASRQCSTYMCGGANVSREVSNGEERSSLSNSTLLAFPSLPVFPLSFPFLTCVLCTKTSWSSLPFSPATRTKPYPFACGTQKGQWRVASVPMCPSTYRVVPLNGALVRHSLESLLENFEKSKD